MPSWATTLFVSYLLLYCSCKDDGPKLNDSMDLNVDVGSEDTTVESEIRMTGKPQESNMAVGAEWIIGIAFVIILMCASSFMCIRVYYRQRKRQKQRKLMRDVRRYYDSNLHATAAASPTNGSSSNFGGASNANYAMPTV